MLLLRAASVVCSTTLLLCLLRVRDCERSLSNGREGLLLLHLQLELILLSVELLLFLRLDLARGRARRGDDGGSGSGSVDGDVIGELIGLCREIAVGRRVVVCGRMGHDVVKLLVVVKVLLWVWAVILLWQERVVEIGGRKEEAVVLL